MPGGDAGDKGGDALGLGAVADAGELKVGVGLLLGALEADDRTEQAAVHLGQNDMHRQVGG